MFTVWVKEQRLDPILGIETMHNITQKDFDDIHAAIGFANHNFEVTTATYVSITAPVGNEKNRVLYTRSFDRLAFERISHEG